MIRKLSLVFAAALLASVATPPSPSADSYSFGSDRGEGGGFGWAIVSGGSSSMSEMQDLDSVDDLKEIAGWADAFAALNVRSRGRRQNTAAMIQGFVSRND